MSGLRAILTYHSIDTTGSVISIRPEVFAAHVRWLSRGFVRVVPLDDLLALDGHVEGGAVAITFDDGLSSAGGAVEQLRDQGLPASVFVVTSQVGGTNAWRGRADTGIPTLPLLSWPEIERLVAQGAAIGAHTRTHARLTALAPAEAAAEMDGCLEDLRARLGVRAPVFAYPYGAVNDRVAALAAARFPASVTARFGALRAGEPRERLPRFDMYYFRRPGALEAWGTPAFTRRLRWIAARRFARRALTGAAPW